MRLMVLSFSYGRRSDYHAFGCSGTLYHVFSCNRRKAAFQHFQEQLRRLWGRNIDPALRRPRSTRDDSLPNTRQSDPRNANPICMTSGSASLGGIKNLPSRWHRRDCLIFLPYPITILTYFPPDSQIQRRKDLSDDEADEFTVDADSLISNHFVFIPLATDCEISLDPPGHHAQERRTRRHHECLAKGIAQTVSAFLTSGRVGEERGVRDGHLQATRPLPARVLCNWEAANLWSRDPIPPMLRHPSSANAHGPDSHLVLQLVARL
ncbi:hypothetical protein C8J56DRAFT_192130 [Mycena floridula]|nr:hypothetical protein C8J56DRAFT_192130 [Mycena floridula]